MSTQRIPITSGQYVDTDLTAEHAADAAWSTISLPVDVHRQLLADGRIADPDFGDNNKACEWVQERSWWFRFPLPDDDGDLTLVLDRLDTRATVWLDGELLGSHANAFRPAAFPLPDALSGATVTVRIDPPAPDADGSYNTAAEHLRKPCYGYGWDFAPCRPSIGIGSVTVVRRDRAAIDCVNFRTLSLSDVARVAVTVAATEFGDADTTVRVQLVDPSGTVVATGDGATLSFTSNNPSGSVGGITIDAVSVNLATVVVPEPAGSVLAAECFGLMALTAVAGSLSGKYRTPGAAG